MKMHQQKQVKWLFPAAGVTGALGDKKINNKWKWLIIKHSTEHPSRLFQVTINFPTKTSLKYVWKW